MMTREFFSSLCAFLVPNRRTVISGKSQIVMFHQTCELQTLAAVDFLLQERWWNVTVLGSGDACVYGFFTSLQVRTAAQEYLLPFLSESMYL